MPNTSIALPDESIEDTILLIRERVILDHDLAKLYGVATRVLNQAAQRILTGFRKISCFSSPKLKLRSANV